MVTITERAGALLQQVQQEQGLTEPPRLVREQEQLALTVSPPDPRDDILYHDGQPVLRVAPEAAAALSGCTITTQESDQGAQLAIIQKRSPDGHVSGSRS